MDAIGGALVLWFGLTVPAALFAAYDLVTRTPAMTVMRWGWVLVILYTGPIGLVVYLLSCREPLPRTHAEYVAPLWKQGVGSTIHCVAGDATGYRIPDIGNRIPERFRRRVLSAFRFPLSAIEIVHRQHHDRAHPWEHQLRIRPSLLVSFEPFHRAGVSFRKPRAKFVGMRWHSRARDPTEIEAQPLGECHETGLHGAQSQAKARRAAAMTASAESWWERVVVSSDHAAAAS